MGTRLLFIDDDEGLRELMVETLRYDGFEVTATPAVDEFFRLLEQERFEAVLCDQNLGEGIKGTAVLQAARARGLLDHTACLLLTGMPPASLSEPWLTVLQKPLEVKPLVEAIRRAIH